VRLLAEAPSEQVIDMLGDVAPPAVADPDERGKLARLPIGARIRANERAQQSLPSSGSKVDAGY